ncbi:MAG: hypothetical protein QXW98_04180 [Candidatus Caldarchaeum sp.]
MNEYRIDIPSLPLGVVRGCCNVINQIIGGPVDSEEVLQAIGDACDDIKLNLE